MAAVWGADLGAREGELVLERLHFGLHAEERGRVLLLHDLPPHLTVSPVLCWQIMLSRLCHVECAPPLKRTIRLVGPV